MCAQTDNGLLQLPPDLQAVSADAVPQGASWFPIQHWNDYPPFPFNWCDGRTNVLYFVSPSFGTNNILVDDPLADATQQAGSASPMVQSGPPAPPPPGGGSGGGGGGGGKADWMEGPGLWLEIFADTNHPGLAQIILYGATNDYLYYQLLSKTNLISPAIGGWVLGAVEQAPAGTNALWFPEVPCTSPQNNFFRAVAGANEAYFSPSGA